VYISSMARIATTESMQIKLNTLVVELLKDICQSNIYIFVVSAVPVAQTCSKDRELSLGM